MATILIIEDDDIMREMMTQALSDYGHSVSSAENGDQGLKLLDTKNVNLIITDILMPEKEGLETIIHIRQKYNKIPIIAVSGGGQINPGNYLDMAKQLGADYILQKPFPIKHLLELVKKCLS